MLATRGLRAGLLGILIPAAAWAQSAPAGSTVVRTPRSLPFTMSQTETRVQTLPDGGTVTHVTTIRTMRDSQGRTRTERVMSGGTMQVRREGDDAYMKRRPDVVQVFVSDPAAKKTMTWRENSPGENKLVTVSAIQPNLAQPTFGVEREPMVNPTTLSGPEAVTRREDLGIKQMHEIYVRGSRTMMTFPAGFDGNTVEYTTSSEYWRSDDLGGLIIESSYSSLGMKTTTTLDSYKPGEPPASVFQAPHGYTVWDRTAGVTQ